MKVLQSQGSRSWFTKAVTGCTGAKLEASSIGIGSGYVVEEREEPVTQVHLPKSFEEKHLVLLHFGSSLTHKERPELCSFFGRANEPVGEA